MVLGGNSLSKVFGIQVRGPKFRSPTPTCKAGHDGTHLWVMEIGRSLACWPVGLGETVN